MFVALLMVGCGEADLSDPEVLKDVTADAVDKSKLQDRSGVTYLPNTQEPFSGYAKRAYENGQIKELAQFKNGYIVRIKEWSENGTPKMEVTLKDGELHGLETLWYKNGQKNTEVNYKDGKMDGLALKWCGNGQKGMEVNWKDGKLISAEVWKPNGEKCPVTNVKDGNGVLVWYNEDGRETGRLTLKDGEEVED